MCMIMGMAWGLMATERVLTFVGRAGKLPKHNNNYDIGLGLGPTNYNNTSLTPCRKVKSR